MKADNPLHRSTGMNADNPSHRSTGARLEVIILLTATALVAGYAAMRFGGRWGETDSNVFATAIRAVVEEGRLVPDRYAYSNGYGFPVLAAFLVQVTGLSVAQLQIFGGALLAAWLVIPAWLAYRELTGSARGATLATVLVLVQPEFLFPILRGTHEKFTRGLMFLCFYLLLRGLMTRQRWRRFAGFLLAFYLAIYALITFNNLLSISFITALGLALALSLFARQMAGAQGDESAATRRRLVYALFISLVLAFFFTFYAYTPARYAILLIQSITDRVAMLFLETEQVVTNPFGTVLTGWISLSYYLIITIANWLLLILSFVIWSTQTVSWWRRRAWPEEPRVILLWSLYGAFGFLGAVSIIVDVSGAIASNLQHRFFPSFAMIAAALLADWFVRRQSVRPAARRPAYVALAALIAFLSIVAVAKATNEPALSNKWTYYAPGEFTALEWSRDNDPKETIRAAFDERLSAAVGICCAWEYEIVSFIGHAPGARKYLLSDVIRAQSERLGLPLPIGGDSLRVYDNGAAEIYHLRPRTPFQK